MEVRNFVFKQLHYENRVRNPKEAEKRGTNEIPLAGAIGRGSKGSTCCQICVKPWNNNKMKLKLEEVFNEKTNIGSGVEHNLRGRNNAIAIFRVRFGIICATFRWWPIGLAHRQGYISNPRTKKIIQSIKNILLTKKKSPF